MHHGVMGMKWGVRRYQNKDGSLTEKGKARFKKVSDSDFLQKRDQKAAIKIIKKNKFIYKPERNVDYYNKKAEKARIKGDTEKMKKYTSNAKRFMQMNADLNKRLSDLESGKIKAGRDFIVQRDYDLWMIGPMISVNKTSTIVENKKTKNTLKNTKTNKHETDEQKIKKLMTEDKINPKANHIFDQNGNLMMVYYDD